MLIVNGFNVADYLLNGRDSRLNDPGCYIKISKIRFRDFVKGWINRWKLEKMNDIMKKKTFLK